MQEFFLHHYGNYYSGCLYDRYGTLLNGFIDYSGRYNPVYNRKTYRNTFYQITIIRASYCYLYRVYYIPSYRDLGIIL